MATKFLSKEQARLGRKWYVVDAKDRVVGRLASEIASVLNGKKNPSYTPNQDSGDFVVVVNASEISFFWKENRRQDLPSSHWTYRRYYKRNSR